MPAPLGVIDWAGLNPPTPHTPHPTPHNPHSTSHTPHPTPYTPNPKPPSPKEARGQRLQRLRSRKDRWTHAAAFSAWRGETDTGSARAGVLGHAVAALRRVGHSRTRRLALAHWAGSVVEKARAREGAKPYTQNLDPETLNPKP